MSTKQSEAAVDHTRRYQTYDGEGIDLGQWSISEAESHFGAAALDPETQTLTVDRETTPAVLLGRKGGKVGGLTKGASKRRSSEQYRDMAKKSAAVRRAKKEGL